MPLENNGVNLDLLVGNLGEYCQDSDVKQEIVEQAIFNTNIENRVTVIDGVIDEAPIVNAEFADPLQSMPDANNVNFKEDLALFDNRMLKVRQILMAATIVPRNLHQNYLALMKREAYKAKANQADPFYIPFEKWLLQKLVEKSAEQMYLNTIFKGVYAPPSTPTAITNSPDLFDGYLKIIADEISANNLTPVNTGVITHTNVIQALQTVYDALPETHKNGMINIHVSPQIFDWLQRSYSSMTNRHVILQSVSDAALAQNITSMPLDGTNAIVYREAGMAGSQRIICTKAGNMHLGYYGKPEGVDIEIQKFNLTLKIIMTFKADVNFAVVKDSFSDLVVNEQI